MTTRQTLPPSDANDLTRALRDAVPELSRTLDSATAMRVNRLADEPPYVGVEFFAVTMTVAARPVTRICARTGDHVLLVEDPTTLERLNQRVGLRIASASAAASYLRTWSRLAGRPTDWIVESADQFSWSPSAAEDPELRAIAEQASAMVHPLRVTGQSATGFRIDAAVMHQQTLQERQYDVSVTGTVSEVSSIDRLSRVPVPYVVR